MAGQFPARAYMAPNTPVRLIERLFRSKEISVASNERGKITSKVSRGKPEGGPLAFLRAAALIAVLAGAVGSLAFLLQAGRRTPRFLLILFVLWVLSPFVALVWANLVSKRWLVLTRATLYSVMLVVTLASLAIYGAVALGLSKARPAPVFLLVPLASWLLTAIVVPIAALISRRQSR